jgi:hypothetical protein
MVGAAGSGVEGFLVGGVGCGEGVEDIAAGAGAGVDEVELLELVEGLLVEVEALALVVAGVGAADVGAFLPLEAEPFEVFEHGFDELGLAALVVEVFVTEEESAVVLLAALLCDPEGAGVTEVEVAGGGGCDASAVGMGWVGYHGCH